MPKFKTKIFIAGVSLLLAVLLLVGASLAWLTISTAPEVTGIKVGVKAQRTLLLSRDTTVLDFQQYIDLTDDFAYLTPLHPVSTVDGLNWFIPTYNSTDGSLNDPDEFILDTTLEYANVTTLAGVADVHDRSLIYDTNGDLREEAFTELDGIQLQERSDLGYYVYADFWLLTEEDNGCNVRLTVPHYNSRTEMEKQETDQGQYGSYVLQTYELSEDDSGNATVNFISRQAETAMRVGFLLNPDSDTTEVIERINTARGNSGSGDSGNGADDENESKTLDPTTYDLLQNKFFIYEPNADLRSAVNKPLGGEKEDWTEKVDYVLGYRFNNENYLDGKYFATQPIKAVTKTKTDERTGETVQYIGGELANISTDKLLIQKHSAWDLTSLQEKLEKGETINSNDVLFPFGGFLKTPDVYNILDADINTESEINNASRIADISGMQTDIAGSSVIVKLTKDTPLKIRLFIWIEGQDVDCWNDIAAGSFIVNLELAGESLPDAE